ncbi:MAG: class I SAM-dependent methyltransferase [Gemmatimonadaceae bacterium]|nr:class I SAM-dependent methyltransferase [Gemmatimonadaceae bacterium]NUO93469.1 class I SAM-dependent methyltransferase [Gemmatimonadaceae bacterium]NUP70771.1 class I SAM-dependent methyltransferase [Gemmatimonadaceae bacterium]NUR35760.1 class I SAM-dependent methyltransferase [Gemmatimonadaceae bacterium]NUS32286.1 class I SAM-dependent methyltransferase [Gemmatimonadaceae bacterium]
MKPYARLMENTLAYRVWQAPFAEQKLAPLYAHNDVARARRVLDVGCGPGTNTAHFAHADYLGIDFNPAYIDSARERYGREFVVADVTKYEVAPDQRFDLILANSLFHHIDTASTRRILAHLATLLSDDGHVHVFDLVLPEGPSVSRLLARADRGEFPRPLEEWRALFTAAFEPVVFEPYPLGAAGMTLWNMIYFKGRARR